MKRFLLGGLEEILRSLGLIITIYSPLMSKFHQLYTEMRFAIFLSGCFITVIVVNPPEKKLAKRTTVNCLVLERKFIFGPPL